ncbi:hypothetical protein [Oerskovia flava]|uniref:hypothetical protein n=1 Tax=Oerskovia flava TaxID=2986422 RepID=UPI00223F4E77|nr:hypothetical protein [Oerskovia sp. JB1-3-2]
MRRVFWVGVGVAITVVVVVKGRQVVARYAPASLVEQATDQVNGAGERATRFVQDFRTEFSRARQEREDQLMASLLAEGQEDPETVRARRATSAGGRHRAPAQDAPDDEDLLGYSFF